MKLDQPKSLRIALLTDGIFPYVLGGMQKHSYYIAKYLAKNGVDVDLYHMAQNKNYDIHKLEFFSEEEKKHIRSFVVDFPSLGNFPGHYLKESYEYSRRIFNVFKNNLNDVDFVYVKGFAGWKLIEEKKKGLKCPPVGIKFHGLNMFQKLPSFKSWLEALLLRSPVKYNMFNADYVFSYGGKITDVTKQIGIPVTKIVEIPTGIDPEWLRQPDEINEKQIRKFIYIGRYERLKGVEELNKALLEIIEKEEIEFHFVGPIPARKRIKSNRIIYHEAVTDIDQLKTKIDKCDVLVCPSYSEGMPNVIIEAMARGLAIIATDVGAVNCLVSKNNGWLLSSSNVNEIKQAIFNAVFLPKQELWAMKKYSYQKVKQELLWDNVAERLISFLRKSTYNHS